MFGQNPKLAPEFGDGETLKIVSIFYTLQGEGPFVGFPAIFIRLGGCNLACSFCDTEFSEFSEMNLADIIIKVKEMNMAKLVVITGGEPLRQPIEKLCKELLSDGYMVQIESNGTLNRDLPPQISVVCSPKSIEGRYLKPHINLRKYIIAYKFIISAHVKGYNAVPSDVFDYAQLSQIYVQPMDEYDIEKNQRNLEFTKNLALEHGYKFSRQLHKEIGLD